MKRDTSLFEDNLFDVIVIGGGIHGATVFYQLAAAGLHTALLEKDDFCAATSANSLKILHGGLRYLQHLNIKRMRESINSRKYFMRMAPHLIEPMPCIMPTYGFGMQGQPIMGIAMMLFDLISMDRNQGAPAKNRVGHGNLLTRQQCLRIGPGINPDGLTGAALWYDDLITSTERMALTFIKEGCKFNAKTANYVKVRKLIRNNNRITGVEATDQMTGKTFNIRSTLVINAAGPWIDKIRKESHQAPVTEDLSKAVNIVINKPLFAGHGVGLSSSGEFIDQDAKIKRGKRLFFFAPWKKTTIIGTTYSYYNSGRDELALNRDDIREILDEVNTIYPLADLTMDDVIFAHAGLMPAHKPVSGPREGTPQLVKHSRIIDHDDKEDIQGLLSIEGVKYTTAPAVARDVETLLKKKKFISADNGDKTVPAETVPSDRDQELTARYAKKYPHIEENFGRDSVKLFEIISKEAGGGNFIRQRPPLIRAEILYCVREEMAVKLSDIVLRRTDCGTTGCPSRHELHDIGSVMAEELGWDEARLADEIDQLLNYFRNTLAIEP